MSTNPEKISSRLRIASGAPIRPIRSSGLYPKKDVGFGFPLVFDELPAYSVTACTSRTAAEL